MSSYFGWLTALLPSRYRRSSHVSAASAIVSGVLELLTCSGLLIYRYILFGSNRFFGTSDMAMKAVEKGGETALMGSGLFLMMEYLIQPLTLLLIYFTLEGLTRAMAALVSDEVIPTLPLQIIAWTEASLGRRYAEHAAGRRVPDEVLRSAANSELRIMSCRPKTEWCKLTTIAYEGELFELLREEPGLWPRKFIYVLGKKPEGKVVRGLHHYSPEEVVRK